MIFAPITAAVPNPFSRNLSSEGHIHSISERTWRLFSNRPSFKKIRVDRMISNAFHSWIWDGDHLLRPEGIKKLVCFVERDILENIGDGVFQRRGKSLYLEVGQPFLDRFFLHIRVDQRSQILYCFRQYLLTRQIKNVIAFIP